jgi:HD-GYP domain-containing protein (c-di-GMP phosphodiesterase class II)/DNA-binding CsgD family transcriptional regulator
VADQCRLAELLGSLSFAGDLGRGQPMGHVLRTCRIAMALADRLRLTSEERRDAYFTAMLVHAGCTAGAPDFAAFLASDELKAQKDFCLCDPNNMTQLLGWLWRNVGEGARAPARVARMLQLMAQGEKAFQEIDEGCSDVGSRIAERLGMPEQTQRSLYQVCESWGGKGPHKLKGGDIPLPARLVNVAMIMEVFFGEQGVSAARGAAKARSGKSFDPTIAAAAVELCDDAAFWDEMQEREPWSAVLELEPEPVRWVAEPLLDEVALAFADIVDLKSGATVTHSRRTAALAEALARRLKLDDVSIALTRRAGLVHDVGLVAVPALILHKEQRLTETEFERYRLHTYYTERILSRSELMRPIGAVASAHHEAIDGSGYHRSLSGSQLTMPMRIVALASRYEEMTAGSSGDPEPVLAALQASGEFDPGCLAALGADLGSVHPGAPRRSWPAGLTEREVDVLRQIASGLTIRQTAQRLVISDHTARHHLESVYSKLGVSSRAGAVLFAVENDLLT